MEGGLEVRLVAPIASLSSILNKHTFTYPLHPHPIQASLLVADSSVSFEITGLGDVLEPKDGVIAIGSGGTFALGACVVLYSFVSLWVRMGFVDWWMGVCV